MNKYQHSKRLTGQHKNSQGAVGIFGEDAKKHDLTVGEISKLVMKQLQEEYPQFIFRYKKTIQKKEINQVLKKLDSELGQTLFVSESSIKPDGGIIQVKDNNDDWRTVLVSEAKFQGKDIENIKKGCLVGKLNNQDLMTAGNAIERAHKNISEIRNFMIFESYFPYVLFLEGSNFLTKTIEITRPDGRIVTLKNNSGALNRLDRLTSANYGMVLNKNLCENKILGNKTIQSASIYTKGNGEKWDNKEMFNIMLEISKTSMRILRIENK
jgi:type II restriction enzyme